MSDVREQRIYCAEQIVVPEELPNILKHYSKAVIKENPADIVSFSAKYFRNLLDQQNNKAKDHIEKPDSHHWSNSSLYFAFSCQNTPMQIFNFFIHSKKRPIGLYVYC